MKKLTVIAAGLILLVPSLAFSDSISLRGSYFFPRAVSNSYLMNQHAMPGGPDSIWTIELDQMSFAPKDYRGGMVGLSYDHFLTKNISLALSVDAYNRSQVGAYKDWVVNTLPEGDFAFPSELFFGGDIVHSFRVTITPVDLSVKLLPLGRRAKIIPYIGGGGSMVFYGVHMFGESVTFGDPFIYPDPVLGDVDIYPVEQVLSRDRGTAFGWHAFGGLQFPVGYRATIEAEARYRSARGDLNGLVSGFGKLEVGGLTLSAGISYWF